MGQSGSFRANALDGSQMGAAKQHEGRLDQVAKLRVKRDTPPLVYSPYSPGEQGEAPPPLRPQNDNELEEVLAMIVEKDPERHLSLTDAYEAHVEGARRNKGASKLCLHAFVQFPTDLKMTPENERLMLAQAVDFVNRNHGGKAVFHARIDRDEEGRHGVDVFYAPKYIKATKRRSEEWVSLTKFGKELAIERFGQKPKEAKTNEKDQETGKPIWKPVLDASGDPITVDCDSSYYQGQALQDLFFEHLRDRMGLGWVQRGEKKVGRDPDRLEAEEYKLHKEREKLERERQASIAEAIERTLTMERAKEQEEASKSRVVDLEEAAARLEEQVESLSVRLKERESEDRALSNLKRDRRKEEERLERLERLQAQQATGVVRAGENAARAALEALRAQIAALEQDAKRLAATKAQLKPEIVKLEEQKGSLSADIIAYGELGKKILNRAAQAKADVDAAEVTKTSLKAEVANLTARKDNIFIDGRKLLKAKKALESEVVELQETTQTLQARNNALKTEFADIREGLEVLRPALQAADALQQMSELDLDEQHDAWTMMAGPDLDCSLVEHASAIRMIDPLFAPEIPLPRSRVLDENLKILHECSQEFYDAVIEAVNDEEGFAEGTEAIRTGSMYLNQNGLISGFGSDSDDPSSVSKAVCWAKTAFAGVKRGVGLAIAAIRDGIAEEITAARANLFTAFEPKVQSALRRLFKAEVGVQSQKSEFESTQSIPHDFEP